MKAKKCSFSGAVELSRLS
ncbi:unnamed protein product [Chironomus riparius]|uniref:Uncharacterized protein n=1 Tax=Chironomus riparius TaxID=315576 RepID=A0A9N9S3C8_9DIPT|nr:unnamed protein product [Chironomus riparius]